jgi:hypothetical protein
MSQQRAAAQFYTCPMHSDVRQQGPGTCPKCKMALIPEGTRFGIVRHMMSNPLHLLAMAALMIAVMAVGMMLIR